MRAPGQRADGNGAPSSHPSLTWHGPAISPAPTCDGPAMYLALTCDVAGARTRRGAGRRPAPGRLGGVAAARSINALTCTAAGQVHQGSIAGTRQVHAIWES